MRITAYSDRLVDDLEYLDWPDKVKAMQRKLDRTLLRCRSYLCCRRVRRRCVHYPSGHAVRRHLRDAGS